MSASVRDSGSASKRSSRLRGLGTVSGETGEDSLEFIGSYLRAGVGLGLQVSLVLLDQRPDELPDNRRGRMVRVVRPEPIEIASVQEDVMPLGLFSGSFSPDHSWACG